MVIRFFKSTQKVIASNRINSGEVEVFYDQNFLSLAQKLGASNGAVFVLAHEVLQSIWKRQRVSKYRSPLEKQDLEQRSLAMMVAVSTPKQYEEHLLVVMAYLNYMENMRHEFAEDNLVKQASQLVTSIQHTQDYLNLIKALWQSKGSVLEVSSLLDIDKPLPQEVGRFLRGTNFRNYTQPEINPNIYLIQLYVYF